MMRSRTAAVLGAAGAMAWALGCGDGGTKPEPNRAPRIVSITAQPGGVILGGGSQLTAFVTDPDGDAIAARWTGNGGTFAESTRTSTRWTAPGAPGTYTLALQITDGALGDAESVAVEVGNASLTVLSDPLDALVTLDGTGTAHRTPWTFDPLPPGNHTASLFSTYYSYPGLPAIRLAHGESETLRFVQPPADAFALDLGRNDILEIGGVAFLPNGSGFLYAARVAGGTGIFSAGAIQASGYGGTFAVVTGVRIGEPIAIDGEGSYLFFVSAAESLCSVYVDDRNGDGLVDSVGTVARLRINTYGPAASTTGEIAFSLGRSEDPPASQLRWAEIAAGGLSTSPLLASSGQGSTPSWKPGESWLAYARNGLLFTSFIDPGNLPTGDTLVAEGYDAAPAWSRWGPKPVAYLQGTDAGNLSELRLIADGALYPAKILDGLSDPRYVAWSPFTRALVVTQNPPGDPQALYVTRMPIP